MLVPMKIDYALRFLVYLTKHKAKGLIKTTEISDIQKIPHKFLLRISNDLQKAGYVKSTRGPLSFGYFVPLQNIFLDCGFNSPAARILRKYFSYFMPHQSQKVKSGQQIKSGCYLKLRGHSGSFLSI